MKPFTQKPATYADLAALPETMNGELIDGELFASPRPAPVFSNATGGILGLLRPAFQEARGGTGPWWILYGPELHFGSDVLVPDIAGWRKARLPELPSEYFELAPDWVCEVLSSSTARFDRIKKLPIYLREGVGYVWLVDPLTQTIEVFRRSEATWLLVGTFGGDDTVGTEPFAECELDLKLLWGAAE